MEWGPNPTLISGPDAATLQTEGKGTSVLFPWRGFCDFPSITGCTYPIGMDGQKTGDDFSVKWQKILVWIFIQYKQMRILLDSLCINFWTELSPKDIVLSIHAQWHLKSILKCFGMKSYKVALWFIGYCFLLSKEIGLHFRLFSEYHGQIPKSYGTSSEDLMKLWTSFFLTANHHCAARQTAFETAFDWTLKAMCDI